MFESKIVGHDEIDPRKLKKNPLNHRVHPEHQKRAMEDVLDEVGYITEIIVNKNTGTMIDGHLRLKIALERGEEKVPVKYVDLTEEQEKIALLTFDASSAAAEIDESKLDVLIADLQDGREELLADLGLVDLDSILESMDSNDAQYELVDNPEPGPPPDKPFWILVAAPKDDGIRIAKALKLRYRHCRVKSSVEGE